ncbi:MAG: OsmC family protein [Promethearchaeia archaeon]
MEEEGLVSKKSLNSFLDRIKNMRKLKFSERADELYITERSATSQQIKNLHVKAKVGGKVLENDESKELGGTGNYLNPMEALLASIANCLETSALIYFSFLNLNVEEIQVKVNGIYDKRSILKEKDSPPPGYYKIHYHWYIKTEEKKQKVEHALQQVEEICPVKATIERQQTIEGRITILNS